MKGTPVVSVIIPFYTRIDWLEEALNSVLSQSFTDYEIIVVNDGSKENLDIIREKFKNKIIIVDKENEGPAIARNEGIKKSKGEYIAFLDSDDSWSPQKLEFQVNEMKRKGAVWSQTSLKYFGVKNKIVDTSLYNGMMFPLCLTSFKIQTSSIVVKKNILIENKISFPKEKRYGQDTYVWLELSKLYPLLAIKGAHTNFRIRKGNAGFRSHVQLLARASMWRDILESKTSIKKNEIPQLIKQIYKICDFSALILEKMKKNGLKEENIEIISKILYVPSWIMFKLASKLELKKVKDKFI